jgi:cyclophilin family peptidyl-prolyl cis-trans isomerase
MHRVRALAGLVLLLAEAGCDSRPQRVEPPLRHVEIAPGPHPVAALDIAKLGKIRVELLPEVAPQTVAEFTRLVGEGYYDDTTFHRVIPDFMIQGGDPNTRNPDPRDDGQGGGDVRMPDEFSDLPLVRGSVALANKNSRHSAASQFFIVQADSPDLNGKYTVFGRVIEGIEVVDAITKLEIDKYGRYGPPDRPYPENAVIQSIKIE